MNQRRRGFTLLELLVSVAVLGIAGTEMTQVLLQTRASMARTHEVEVRLRRAATLLSQLSLESGESLRRRVGRRIVQGHEVRIAQLPRELFRLTLADPTTGAVLLETIVHRPADGVDAH